MLGISDEAFILDATSLQLIAASDSACRRLNCTLAAMQKKDMQTVLGTSQGELAAFVSSHQLISQLTNSTKKSKSTKKQLNKVNFIALANLNLALIHVGKLQYLFAIKGGVSGKTSQPLDESNLRFKALVKNTPGLVLEFQLDPKGEISFGYVSDGCKALLGVEVEALKKSPEKLFKNVEEADLTVLQANLQTSATELTILNWDGRLWIEEWQDTKWVNLRATPRKLKNGVIRWAGIMTNVTQSKNEKLELRQSHERLAELSAHLTHVKEEERSHIAREIHDDLGGNLTVMKIGLTYLLKHLPKDQPLLIEKVKNLETIVNNTFESAHRISGDLRPNILELGIVAALDWQAKEFQKQMEIPCHFVTNHQDAKGTKEQEITLFRICQEAMSNIAKYAKAKRVDVALFFGEDSLKMYITDDGIGINPSDVLKPNAFGLRGMEERVAALNGEFSIEKLSDSGTNITVALPNQKEQKS